MHNHILKNKIVLILVVVVMVFSVISQDAYARGGGGRGGGGRGGRGGYGWGDRGWYGDRWYNDGWWWFGAGMTALALGSIVPYLPPYYSTVCYGGVPYYYYNGAYFSPCSYGYTVVQAPAAAPVVIQQPYAVAQPVVSAPIESANVVQTAPQGTQGEPFTVNVPNYKGGWTSVTLTRSGTGFIGPQGEYYQEFPKIKQLKEMYGK